MNQKTKKLMTVHKAFPHWNYKDRLYVLRKVGERGLTSIEDSMDVSIQGLEDYIKKSKEGLTIVANDSTDKKRTNRTTITKKHK